MCKERELKSGNWETLLTPRENENPERLLTFLDNGRELRRRFPSLHPQSPRQSAKGLMKPKCDVELCRYDQYLIAPISIDHVDREGDTSSARN